MEDIIKGGFKVKINQDNNTCKIVKIPKDTKNVFIPRFAEYGEKKYKIISFESKAFDGCHIDLLSFANDSDFKSFSGLCFSGAYIKKIRIPARVENLNIGWCSYLHDLNEIEISPNNHHFIFYNNEFLLGKSDDKTDKFDVLYYAQFDIKEAMIPAQVSVIKPRSFNCHRFLKSVKFSPNSELKRIEDYAFSESSIESLSLPASVEKIADFAFCVTPNLNRVEVSADNKFFKLIDDKYIVRESIVGSGIFDVIIFARRDIESIIIPSHIKTINNHAFDNCKRLEKITFESNSSLETLKRSSFIIVPAVEEVVLPPSLKEVGDYSFLHAMNVKRVVFLSKSLKIGKECFSSCDKLTNATFQNADQISFGRDAFSYASDELEIFVRSTATLSGFGLADIESRINYIEKVAPMKEEEGMMKDKDVQTRLEEENSILKKFVSYLRSHLSKYEEVMSFEDFKNQIENGEIKEEIDHLSEIK